MSNNRITIVIPCYNQSQYLNDCLNSVIAQNYSNWKVIVIDDCSTNNDPEKVIKKINDSRITLIRHNVNKGLAATRNTGFKKSKTDLVLPLDADDLISPLYLEKINALLQSYPDVDCIFSDIKLFGTQHGVWKYSIKDKKTMTLQQWIPGAGTLIKKKLWVAIGGYCEDEELKNGNEDWDFWLTAVDIGINPMHIAEPLYLYRQTENSMVKQLLYNDYYTREFIYERHRKLFDNYGTGGTFLSQGYRNSAIASWKKRKILRTSFLVTKLMVNMIKTIKEVH